MKRLFYVLDYKLPGRTLDVGTTFDQHMAKMHKRCTGVDLADLSAAFYNVNVYNMYILLEVFNEDHMSD